MKFETIKILILVIAFFCGYIWISQNETKKDSSFVSIDINFISDTVFMERKNSISNPYLYSSITYYPKSDFYGTGSVSYLTKAYEDKVNLFLLTAGFDFSIIKLDDDTSVTKYFFNADSYNVISKVEVDLTAQLVYDFNIVNLGITSRVYLNSDGNSNVFLSSEINHDIISKNEKFQISQTAGLYFESQYYYEQYYINNRFGNRRGQQGQGNNNLTQTAVTNIKLTESKKFGLITIEFSSPMGYVKENNLFYFDPCSIFLKA